MLNFAVSAIALLSATLYSALRRGELLLIVPGLPHAIETGELGFWPAAALTLLITAAFGLLLYVLIFRPLRRAPAVASAVASLGVSVVIVALISKREGTAPSPVDRIFPDGQFHLGDVTVSKDRVFVALTVVAIAALIWALWRFTRFGLVSRAVSSSEKGAYVSGIPADRVAAANWMLSAMVAGIAGILIAPIVAPVPIEYTLFIVPALAVATLGGFQRLLPTVLGGLALGMIQSELVYLQLQHSWIPAVRRGRARATGADPHRARRARSRFRAAGWSRNGGSDARRGSTRCLRSRSAARWSSVSRSSCCNTTNAPRS